MQNLFGRSLILFAASTVAALALSALAQGGLRSGALAGVITATLSTCFSLVLLKLTFERGVKQVLAAISAGFLLRMMAVAAGLLVARALGGELLAFAAGFFGLYLVHQTIEIAVVARRTRARAVESKA